MSTNTVTQLTNKVLASDPDGDVVDELFQGFAQFLILENALKTDILDHIDKESSPVAVTTLSTKYGYNPDVLERLLDNLAAMRLIRKHYDEGQWKYSNTRTTSVYLTKGSEFYKGDVLQVEKILLGKTSSSIIQTLRTGPRNQMEKFIGSGKMMSINANSQMPGDKECESLWYQELDNESPPPTTAADSPVHTNTNSHNSTTKCGQQQQQQHRNQGQGQGQCPAGGAPDHSNNGGGISSNNSSKPSVKVLMKSMDAMMYSCRHVIPETFDLREHRVAVDLGGGTGYLARLLTDHYPLLTATVFELPHVVAMARSSQPIGHGGNGRVNFVAGDFFQDDIPGADLYILSRVLHGWDETKCRILLNKIYRKLPAGGKLLILEKFLNERKDGPIGIMNIHLNMSSISDGRERTAKEYQNLVENQGFADTQVRLISGVNLFDALLTCKPFSV